MDEHNMFRDTSEIPKLIIYRWALFLATACSRGPPEIGVWHKKGTFFVREQEVLKLLQYIIVNIIYVVLHISRFFLKSPCFEAPVLNFRNVMYITPELDFSIDVKSTCFSLPWGPLTRHDFEKFEKGSSWTHQMTIRPCWQILKMAAWTLGPRARCLPEYTRWATFGEREINSLVNV